MRALPIAAAILSASSILAAQAPQTFEVTSVKPRTGERPLEVGAGAPDRFRRADITLRLLIRYAYDLQEFEIDGGPDWVSSARWEVTAKASGPVRPPQMRLLVRRMLEDRFGLKTHVETRELPSYELVMVRRDGGLGVNLKPAATDCSPFLSGERPMQESPRDEISGMPLCSVGGRLSAGLITPRLNGQPLAALARYLEAQVGRRVIDKTGLTGNYDVTITYLEEAISLPPGAQRKEGPALFTALQEQLGLRLESSRGPVDVMVIDSAHEPTPD
jgi:uncharacterized protein (TIGR03435 family)